MKSGPRYWAALVVLNLVLAVGAALLAPTEIGTTADRVGYEYVGQHPLGTNCPYSIYCYRLLVPTLLEHVPLSHEVSWRGLAVIANFVTGVLLSEVALVAGATPLGGFIAAILYQMSFGATFAVFDPFTPDPIVYLAAALLALCWLRQWPVLGLVVVSVTVFAKETVALVVSTIALASWFQRPSPERKKWMTAAIVAATILVSFHVVMDLGAGWNERGSASTDLLGGSFLVRWLTDPTLTASARLLYIFIPFGFAWIFAVLGIQYAPGRMRALALASLILLTPLIYVQTVERALATASFAVVPLAALSLARVPFGLAFAAAVANGLLTARVGLSTSWLPPVPYLLSLAGILAALTILRGWIGSRVSSTAAFGSSLRTTSSK